MRYAIFYATQSLNSVLIDAVDASEARALFRCWHRGGSDIEVDNVYHEEGEALVISLKPEDA